MTGVHLRVQDGDTHREDSHVKTEAGTGVILPPAQAHLGLPEAGRGKEGAQRLWREHDPVDT